MEQILRKLDFSEILLHIETEALNLMNTRTILVKSSFDLFSNIKLIENAIYEWKQKHHLLRCCIKQEKFETMGHKQRYFVYAPQEKIDKSSGNVEYLYLKSNSGEIIGDKYWQDLLENEFTRSLNCENELLWRLKFIKVETDSKESFFYRLIFTIHHGIADGKNAFCLLQQLLQIIEDLYLNKYKKENNYEVLLPLKELLCKNKKCNNNNNNNNNNNVDESEAELTSYKVPEFFKPTTDLTSNICFKENYDVIIYRYDHSIYMHLNDILNENINKSNTKFTHFKIENQTFVRLLEVCKKHNLKLTGLISTIISISIQLAYKHFSNDEKYTEILRYYIAVNLRPHFDPPMDNYKVGNYATIFYFENCLNNLSDDDQFWMSDLWLLAKREFDEIHRRLKVADYMESLDEDERFAAHLENGFEFSDFEKHFCLSNLGDMTAYASTTSKTFSIEDHYVFMSYRRTSAYNVFFEGLVTMNSCLYWSISYPFHLIKFEVVEYLVKSIENIISKIIINNKSTV